MHARVMLVLAILLAGCDALSPGPDGPEASPSPTVEDDPRSEGEATGCEDLSASDAGPAALIMQDNEFVHPCFAVSSTQRLQLVNSGSTTHNFSIDGEVDIDVEPGERTNTDPLEEIVAPGTYDFACKYHEGAGMIGEIIVE
ncbi:MAG TPA: plastocyanin/azurin family copper-binding protein [Actinomycetota bacterium]|nr:plastocyanin/azurin family copper-binding protein [Actinomycetota bacterium]